MQRVIFLIEELNRYAVVFANSFFVKIAQTLTIYNPDFRRLLLIGPNLHTVSFAIPSA
jgi:hypothetical protein